MRFRLFVLAVCTFAISAFSQDSCDCFDRLYNLSNNQSDNNKSIVILKDAISFLDYERGGEYYWEVAHRYCLIRRFDSAAEWYSKAIEWGYSSQKVERDAAEAFEKLDLNRIYQLEQRHRRNIDFFTYEEFVKQNALDQAVRGDVMYSWDDSALKSREVLSFVDSMIERVDDRTFSFIKMIFDKYSFPTYRELGFTPVGISSMILHLTARNDSNARYVFKELDKFSRACEYLKSDLMLLLDRQKYIATKRTYCGLFGSGERYLSVVDVQKVDSMRFEYNRVRLLDEASANGMKLPVNYVARHYPKNYFCMKKYEVD
jgi:tetratricopeptide (TPR) repeat protein